MRPISKIIFKKMYQPYRVDLFDDEKGNFRTQYRRLFDSVEALSDHIQHLYDIVLDEDEHNIVTDTYMDDAENRAHVEELFEKWHDAFMDQIEQAREIRCYKLKVGPEKTVTLRTTIGVDIFYELTRLYYLKHRTTLIVEEDNLRNYSHDELGGAENYTLLFSLERHTQHRCWVGIVNSFEVPAKADEPPEDHVVAQKQKVDALWRKPIMQFTQSEVRLLIMFLSQMMNELPAAAVPEFKRVFHICWLRVAALSREHWEPEVLDDDAYDPTQNAYKPLRRQQANGLYSVNRECLVFYAYYMGEMMRRLHHYDMLVRFPIAETAALGEDYLRQLRASTEEWVQRVVNTIPDDAFDEMYDKMKSDGYSFLGADDMWFSYFYPTKTCNRNTTITVLRPHLHARFFSEMQVTKESVLKMARIDNYTARLFVFRAIQEFLHVRIQRCKWMDSVVISSEGIEMSDDLLSEPDSQPAPVLLQVLASFWPYYCGCVHQTDDLYEQIGLWFWLLREHYNSTLFDVDLTEFVNQIVPARRGMITNNPFDLLHDDVL